MAFTARLMFVRSTQVSHVTFPVLELLASCYLLEEKRTQHKVRLSEGRQQVLSLLVVVLFA